MEDAGSGWVDVAKAFAPFSHETSQFYNGSFAKSYEVECRCHSRVK